MTYTYTPSTLSNTRVDAADILRGIAIGGIVMLHFIEHMNFYQFPELTILDQVVWNAMFFLCGGKMYAIFSAHLQKPVFPFITFCYKISLLYLCLSKVI